MDEVTFQEAQIEWIIKALQRIASRLDVALDEPPGPVGIQKE